MLAVTAIALEKASTSAAPARRSMNRYYFFSEDATLTCTVFFSAYGGWSGNPDLSKVREVSETDFFCILSEQTSTVPHRSIIGVRALSKQQCLLRFKRHRCLQHDTMHPPTSENEIMDQPRVQHRC